MSTPPRDDAGWSDPTAARATPPPEQVSGDNPPVPAPFDPYRFGPPDHPVPPEYAPPGYQPPYTAPSVQQPGQHPGYSPYSGSPSPGGQPPGWPYPHPPPAHLTQYPQPSRGNGKATAGLVLGIVSIVFFWTSFFDAIPVILGLIFGILGLNEAKRMGGGRSQAIAGIVCALVGAVLAIVLTVVVISRIQPCLNSYNSGTSEFNNCIRHHI